MQKYPISKLCFCFLVVINFGDQSWSNLWQSIYWLKLPKFWLIRRWPFGWLENGKKKLKHPYICTAHVTNWIKRQKKTRNKDLHSPALKPQLASTPHSHYQQFPPRRTRNPPLHPCCSHSPGSTHPCLPALCLSPLQLLPSPRTNKTLCLPTATMRTWVTHHPARSGSSRGDRIVASLPELPPPRVFRWVSFSRHRFD